MCKKFYAVFLGEDQVSPVYESYTDADAWAEEHFDLDDDRVSIEEVENPDDYGKPIDVILKEFNDGTLNIDSLFSDFFDRESKDVVGKRFLNHLKGMLPTNKFDSSKDWVRFDFETTGGCMLGDPYYGLSYTMEIFNGDTCLWLIYRNLAHDLEVKDQNDNIYIFSNWRELKDWFKQ